MAHDVFISHSAKDKTTADAVCAMLESNGVRCWIAPRDVTPGMEWGQCIIEAIEQSRIMILVFTAHANESSQIRREIERAVNHGVAILPVRIEDVLPGKALEFFIGNVHWLDARTPPLEIHLKNLAGTVKMLLGRMEPRDAGPIPHTEDAGSKAEAAEAAPTPKAKTGLPEVPPESPSVAAKPSEPIGDNRARAAEPVAEKLVAPAPAPLQPQRPILSGAGQVEATKTVARQLWLRWVIIGASLVIVTLVMILFFIPSGSRRIVRNPGRLELALVADFSPTQTGAPLLNYSGATNVYGVVRHLTLPGDIESVAEAKDANGTSALDIRLTDAAVTRMNSGASIVDHDMALVLDGRTVLTVARVRDPLGNDIVMTGNFSADDMRRLLDASSSGAPQPTNPPPEMKDWSKEAFSAVDAAAKQGIPEAQYELGDRYYSGRDGAKKDYEEAVRWFRAAAGKGSADAQFRLGSMYLFGFGVPKDPARAVMWYRKAADQGNIKGENDLGAIYEGGGGSGFPEDDAEALIWFRKAADQGSAEAQTNIGNLYYMDPSKPRDFAKALFWYRKAAEQGYAAAESQLGDLYQYGNGVPKDLVQARAWYQKAADQGDAGAKQSLANLDHEH